MRARAAGVRRAARVVRSRCVSAARFDGRRVAVGDLTATSELPDGTRVTLTGACSEGPVCVDGPSGGDVSVACGAGSGLGLGEASVLDADCDEGSGAGL